MGFVQGPRRRREREKGIENVFEEIVTENFHSLKKGTDIEVQEEGPNKMNPNRCTPRRIIIKTAKVRILKAAREKQSIIHKGIPISLSPDFSAETLQARREQHDIFKVPKGKTCNLGYSTQQDYR